MNDKVAGELGCEAGYLAAPSLRTLNTELVDGMKAWKELDACPACAGRSLARFATIKELSYGRCCTCGLRFANPSPSDEVISNFYNGPFYSNYRRLEENRIARDKYFSVSIGLDAMLRLGAWLGDNKTARVLDYGCGPGTFMALLRDRFGFSNVEGLELNRQSSKIAKQSYSFDLHRSPEELEHASFDYIVLLEVLEHTADPDAFLRRVTTLLKPGGRILITTPAVDNPISIFLPSHSEAPYSAPCHISLFTKKALMSLLTRLNFGIERLEVGHSWSVMEKIMANLFYDLDFLSPRHDDDCNDSLYVPNALGRLLGLKPRRSLSSLYWRLLRRADSLVARIVRRYLRVVPMNGHMYVLALQNS